jgi:hypothetical protein
MSNLGLDRGRVCRVAPHGYALGTLVASADALPATIRYFKMRSKAARSGTAGHPPNASEFAQIRTGPIRAYGSRLGCVTAKRFSLRFAVCAPARGTRLPGSESGACFAGSHSPWPPPLAPPAPRPVARLCSSASQLLWQSLTSRDRASSATAPRLPDTDRRRLPNGRSRDLPVPVQGASAHARFFDHAGSTRRSRWRACSCCLPHSKQRRHPDLGFRGSMAGLCPPLPTLRRSPRGRQRTARGRCSRYSFIVVDLHHLLLAGLPAHFESFMPSHAVGSPAAKM